MGGIKRSVCLGVCLALALCTCAFAEEAPLFSVKELQKYAVSADMAFPMDGLVPWFNWRYSVEREGLETYRYPGGRGDAPRLCLMAAGNGADGYPYLGLQWTDADNWRVQAVALRVGTVAYLAAMGKSRSFFHCQRQGEDGYLYSLLIPLGSVGPGLLAGMQEQGFRCMLRVYDRAGVRLAAQWDGGEDTAYGRFYQGLTAAGYLDGEGRAQRSLRGGLEVIDGVDYFPKVKAALVNEELWPESDQDAATPALKRIAALEAATPDDQAGIELLRQGSWKRSGDAAKLSLNVRSHRKDGTVARLTFLCCIQENDDIVFLSEADGASQAEVTVDATVKPGKKAAVSLRLEGVSQAAAVLIGVREIAYADGTVETVPLREIAFVRYPF